MVSSEGLVDLLNTRLCIKVNGKKYTFSLNIHIFENNFDNYAQLKFINYLFDKQNHNDQPLNITYCCYFLM